MSSESKVLDKKMSRRAALRKTVSDNLKNARVLIEDEKSKEMKVLGLKNSLTNLGKRLGGLNDEILELLEPEYIEGDVLESEAIDGELEEILAGLTLKLKTFSVKKTTSESTEKDSGTAKNKKTEITTKLPKLTLPVFKGNPLNWQTFWDRFESCIHKNSGLSDVEKFNYLKTYLDGVALSTISTLTLTSENYNAAIEVLSSRFGNPQILISAHMDSLLKLPKIRNFENVEGLRKLYNDVENCVRNLKSLKVETSTYGCLLIPILKDRLPDDLNVLISRKFASEVWTLDLLLKYFHEELIAKEICTPIFNRNSSKQNCGNNFSGYSLYAESSGVQSGRNEKCVFCYQSGHSPSQCKNVSNVDSRIEILKKYSKCFLCLKSGHISKKCSSKYICRKCQGKHHISICKFDQRDEKGSGVVTHVNSSKTVLLQTARANVFDSEFKTDCCSRILFDTGSQRNFITENLRRHLNLKTVRTEKIMINVFGQPGDSCLKILDVVQIKIKHRFENKFVSVEALVHPVICRDLKGQLISVAKEKYNHISKLTLADFEEESETFPVGILIGVENYYDFFLGKTIKGTEGPIASSTVLGWVLSGNVKVDNVAATNLSFNSHILRCDAEVQELRDDLSKFWNIEDINSVENCVTHKFEKDIFHNGERYVTKLPFKPDHDVIPDNFKICESRVKNLKRKLMRENLIEDYSNVFVDYEKNNIIEKVPEIDIPKGSGEVHYLPHRPIIKPERKTTKIRPVFDASCSTEGPSLNNCLYSGPNLLSKIFDILIRFRFNPIGIIADIKQAFLNVQISDEHKDFLRFLWYDVRKPDSDEICVYRFLRVVFGLTSSPFLLNATVRHHLKGYLVNEKEFVEKFLEDLYVDDSNTGVNTVEEGKRFYHLAKQILSEAGLHLRKWITNNDHLQKYIDSFENPDRNVKENVCDISYSESQFLSCDDNKQRVLGIEWDVSSDEFLFNTEKIVKLAESLEPTKRNILKVSATFFDPLGVISPITARVKVIFQLLCKDKKGWDENVTGEVKEVWRSFMNYLREMKEIRLKRFCFTSVSERVESVEMHGFCDSSKHVYCAVIYLRIKTSVGVRVEYVAGKTRVTPLKIISIPRLELLGCLLLSKLYSEVCSAVSKRVSIENKFCWTDSVVALCWISGKEKSWKPWVENRVVKIRKVLERERWSHIEGVENPADIPTRNCSEEDFKRWLLGPEFLKKEEFKNKVFVEGEKLKVVGKVVNKESKVSKMNFVDGVEGIFENCVLGFCNLLTVDIDSVNKVVKEHLNFNVNIDTEFEIAPKLTEIIDIQRYSSLKKLLIVTCYVVKFISKLKCRLSKQERCFEDTITVDEYKDATERWIKCEQSYIRTNTNFKKLYASLKLFEDSRAVLRLKGRFENSLMSYDEKYPIILRSDSYFTKLLVLNAHKNVMHQGIESTLNDIRSRYWIIKGRKTIKNIIRKCVICKRHQGRTLQPPETPDLPDFRIQAQFAFQTVGLDFAGPLFVKCNRDTPSKAYFLIFTCTTSRAVHLELVPDMKAPAFIRAFRRFSSRRGSPDMIINDNFKTFKSDEVKRFMLYYMVKQKFILPASPWWGGFYERLVRSVKLPLRKILGKSLLTYEEIETILCEIECVINSRPLIYVSEDDLQNALTPFHLICGRNLAVKSYNIENDQFDLSNITKRYNYIQKVIKDYWNRFSKTYLNELRQHHIYKTPSRERNILPNIGDVVLIRDDTCKPRCQWRTGKIEEHVVGRDEQIRRVKLSVISKNGARTTCYRPLQKIIPFEVNEATRETVNVETEEQGVAREGSKFIKGRKQRRAALEARNKMKKLKN